MQPQTRTGAELPITERQPSWMMTWGTLIATSLSVFVLIIDVTAINVALPSIQTSLDASFTDLQWVIDAYALALASTVLVFGSLGDRFGRKRVFICGVVVFGLASLCCGLAGSTSAMHAFRVAQGLGAAAMLAGSLSLIATAYQGRARDVALAVWGGAAASGVAVGPLVGGVILSVDGWKSIFLINLPLVALTLALASRTMRESADDDPGRRTDLGGLVTLSGAMATLVLALFRGGPEGWTSPLILTLFAGSAGLAALFVVIERRIDRPLVDLELLRSPAMAGASVAMLASSAAVLGLMTYVVFYFQNLLAHDALETGLRLLPMTVGSFVTSFLSARLLSRTSASTLVGVGLLFAAAGATAGYVQIDARSDWTAFLLGGTLIGLCYGLIGPATAHTTLAAVPEQRVGMASGINNTCRQLGLALGVAGFGALLHAQVGATLGTDTPGAVVDLSAMGHATMAGALASPEDPSAASAVVRSAFIDGFHGVLLVSALIALAGAALATVLLRRAESAARDLPGPL